MILNELSIRGNSMDRMEMNHAISQFLGVCHKISHEKDDRDFLLYCGIAEQRN